MRRLREEDHRACDVFVLQLHDPYHTRDVTVSSCTGTFDGVELLNLLPELRLEPDDVLEARH